MSALCFSAGAATAILQLTSFTLAWTHSVEHILWEEDWYVEDTQLVLSEARIRGSGAGMDPPEGAVLRDGVWHYRAERRVARLNLSSGSGQPEYQICTAGECLSLPAILGPGTAALSVELRACAMP